MNKFTKARLKVMVSTALGLGVGAYGQYLGAKNFEEGVSKMIDSQTGVGAGQALMGIAQTALGLWVTIDTIKTSTEDLTEISLEEYNDRILHNAMGQSQS